MTTPNTPPSQPESLDLYYDLWQGQFEFVGTSHKKSTDITKSESVEDLNLKGYMSTNQPNLNDSDNSGPHSGFSIQAFQFINEDENHSGKVCFLLF